MAEHDSGIANSFTDLMTSLAVIFILLLCAMLNNAFEEGQDVRVRILKELQTNLKDYREKGLDAFQDPNDPLALLILIPEGLLEFSSDSAQIPGKGQDFLNSFVPKLTNTIYQPEFRKDISSVVVEGHADSTGGDTHNLKLSQDRSMSVVSKSLDILNPKSGETDEKKNYFLKVLSASGRGKQELIRDENGNEIKSKSRRVVFKIRVKSIEEKNKPLH